MYIHIFYRYDPHGEGKINFQSFLQHLSAKEFVPGDQQGMSYTIMEHNRQQMEEHLAEQQNKQEQMASNQANHTAVLSVDELLQQLKLVSLTKSKCWNITIQRKN